MAEIIHFCILSCMISISILNSNALPAQEFYPALPTKPDRGFGVSYKDNGVLSMELCTTNISKSGLSYKSGINGEKRRWYNGFTVHPDPTLSEIEMGLINAAMYELSQKVCIRFGVWPQNSQPMGDYVFIKKGLTGTGCRSSVGRRGGKQELNLEPGCVNEGVILHELIHALGFHHEQSRPDRDNFVNIHWENIGPGKEGNFRKYDHSLTFGVPYDYNSIMHYGSSFFSRNYQETITAKKPGQSIGSTGKLTSKDIEKLRKMYNCLA